MVTAIERESLTPVAIEKDFLKEPNGYRKGEEVKHDGDSFSLCLKDAAQFPLLSQEQEVKLGWQIFAAKLALRNLRTILAKNINLDGQKPIVEPLLVKGLGKNLLDTFDREIKKRKKTMGELEKKRGKEDISEYETRQLEKNRAFLEDVRTNDDLAKQKLETPSDITPFIRQNLEIFKKGNEAFTLFVESNLRLVVFIARRLQEKGLSLDDLVGYGHEGLMKAVAKFDPRRGYRFSTFATEWIKEAITRAIRNEAPAPEYLQLVIERLERQQAVLEQQRKEEVELEVLAKGGVSTRGKDGEIVKIEEATVLSGLATRGIASLNKVVGEERYGHETELGEFVRDKGQGTDEEAVGLWMKDQIRKALFVLSPKQKLVIALRFGLMDGRERTLEEVGKIIGKTRARAEQIEKDAFRKLRPALARLRDE